MGLPSVPPRRSHSRHRVSPQSSAEGVTVVDSGRTAVEPMARSVATAGLMPADTSSAVQTIATAPVRIRREMMPVMIPTPSGSMSEPRRSG